MRVSVTRMSGIVYLVGAVAFGAGFVYHALALMFREDSSLPMKTFGYSIVYLFGIFACLLVDHHFQVKLV